MGVIVYDRETSHLFSPSYSVNGEGLNVVTTINAGRKRDRGAEFDISTPLLRRVKATASVNLFDSRVPIDPVAGDGTIEAFRYTGNATLEWDGPERRGKPGDIGQLQIVYEGPSRSFQIREKGDFLANLSYTHSFNRTLSLNGTVSGIGTPHSRHRLLAPLVQEDFIGRRRMLEFRLKLIKTFGAAK
jgi:outer membrane receptor for ferrienterochelin and colicin